VESGSRGSSLHPNASQPEPKLPLPIEAPFDAATIALDAADVLVEALLKDGLPRDKLEAHAILDHGEAPTGEIGDTSQSAGNVFPRPGRGKGQPPFGGHLLTDALHFLLFQSGDGPTWDADEVVLGGGVPHLHESLRAPIEGVVHLLAEAGPGKRKMVACDKLPVEPGRAIAAHLAVEVQRGQRAVAEILRTAGSVIGNAPLGDVVGDSPMVGVDALDMAGPAQGFQPADVGTDEGVRVAVALLDDVLCDT
jgi:hypothetical protein